MLKRMQGLLNARRYTQGLKNCKQAKKTNCANYFFSCPVILSLNYIYFPHSKLHAYLYDYCRDGSLEARHRCCPEVKSRKEAPFTVFQE